MQAGQVSVWVPIVVALLGIIGVIAGQLINSWRESLRWKRELSREDLRWDRENAREALRRDHEREVARIEHSRDLLVKWRENRLEVYSSFLDLMRRWADDLRQLTRKSATGRPGEFVGASKELVDRLWRYDTEAWELQAKMELVASESVHRTTADIIIKYYVTVEALVNPDLFDEPYSEIVTNSIMSSQFLSELFRDDLGIAPEAEAHR